MKRLFLALDLPPAIKDALLPWQNGPGGGLRPVNREGLHLTLCFIGMADAEMVHQAVATRRAGAFSIQISGLGYHRHARGGVLWAGVEANDALFYLREQLSQALQQADLPTDSKRFRPHITLARCRRNIPQARIEWLLRRGEQLQLGPVPIDRFVLFSSETRPEGALYQVEHSYPLATGGGARPD